MGAIPAVAQYWKNVRSIARVSLPSDFFPSLGKAAGNPFDSLFVVYTAQDFGGTNNVFQIKRSPNVGVTFSDSIEINTDAVDLLYGGRITAIAHDAKGIHVVINATYGGQPGIYYFRSTDGGSTWTTPFRVDFSNTNHGWNPAIALDPFGFTVFWINGTGGEVLYCRRCDYFSGWKKAPVLIDGGNCFTPQALAIQYLGGNGAPIFKLYVVYSLYSNNTWVPWCQYSTDFGQNWTYAGIPLPQNYSSPSPFTPAPSLTGRDGVNNVYVLYAGKDSVDTTGSRIFCSQVGGSSYSRLTNLPSQYFDQQLPRLSLGPGDTLYAVWQDDRAHSGWPEIYFDRSTDGGQTWLEDPVYHLNRLISRNANQSPYSCSQPDIIADGWNQVVVWDSTVEKVMYRKRSSDTLALPPTSGIYVSQVGSCLYLSWYYVTGVAGWNVYRADGYPHGSFKKLTPQALLRQPCNYTDCTANPNYCYTYYVTAVDSAENESKNNPTAFWNGCMTGPQMAAVDPGAPNPSPITVRRAGYYTWGSTPDSTVDYDPDSLVYRFRGLTPDSLYLLGVGYFTDSLSRGRQQSLNIDGVQAHGAIPLLGTPSKMLFLVPKRTYQDSTVTVSVVRNQGPDAVVAQLWLYQAHLPNGGPQSAGVVNFTSSNTYFLPLRPNPSNGRVQVAYHLPGPAEVSLVVYDVLGQRIKGLVNGTKLGGSYAEEWDGRDEQGVPVKTGVYFARLQVGAIEATQKLVLVR